MQSSGTPTHPLFMGETAQRLVAPSTFKGVVIAAVKDAVYLESDTKEVFWLVPGLGPRHNRSINGIDPLPEVKQGTSFTGGRRVMRFSKANSLDLSNHRIWQNQSLDPDNLLSRGTGHQRAIAFGKKIMESPEKKGFAKLMPVLFEGKKLENKQDLVLVSAAPICVEIHRACKQKNLENLLNTCGSLVGLGNGLTPSGDDFLGGCFFALYYLSSFYPMKIVVDYQAIYSMVDSLQKKTNSISWTLLHDMTHGKGMESLHNLMDSIVTNISLDVLSVNANKLTTIGNSTGWDILTGLFCGLEWIS